MMNQIETDHTNQKRKEMSYDNAVDSAWEMSWNRRTFRREEKARKKYENKKMWKSVTNLIDCIHFYGVLPTLKIYINRKVSAIRIHLHYAWHVVVVVIFTLSKPCT